MNENTTLNALLALLEGRPELARSYLRAPGSNVVSITDFQTRIYSAMDALKNQAVKTALRDLLNVTVRASAPEDIKDPDEIDAYTRGVQKVEDLITEIIHKCESTELH
jgi:hypothetical protein